MKKKIIILLLLFLSVLSVICKILPSYSSNNLTATEKMLIQIIKECNIGFKNTIYYTGKNSDFTQAQLSTASSVDLESWILMYNMKHERFVNFTAMNGIVAVINSEEELKRLRKIIPYDWECAEDCKVIVLSEILNSCDHAVRILKYLGYFYFDISYFICNHKYYGPMVITQDKYSRIQRAYWRQFSAKVESLYDGRFYYRKYDKDLCRNLDFPRKKPSDNPRILLGVKVRVEDEEDVEEGFIFRRDLSYLVDEDILILQKITKIKFVAYVQTYLHKRGENRRRINEFLWFDTHVDVLKVLQRSRPHEEMVFTQIGFHDTVIILSHKPAEATPLQKIAKFYGIWTLVSLIILLIITFVVIYLKTNRNAALASFDVLRLLINSGVEIPINTLSLKIFFCIIFLYFLVIHSTFSGNLPRFLTLPEFHDNIDSIEDLSNPRITTVYDRGFCKDIHECKNDKIERKMKYLSESDDVIDHFMIDKHSVCIIEKSTAEYLISEVEESIMGIHMSKNDFGTIKSGIEIRRRFYGREKIQRSATYMLDVGLIYKMDSRSNNAQRIITRQHIIAHVKFRNISINDLKFAFIFLIIGNTLGLLCFSVELMVGKEYYQKISFKFFKKCLTFKRKKNRMKIQRIVVRPRLDLTVID